MSDQVKAMALEGKLLPDDLIRVVGTDQWATVASVPSLRVAPAGSQGLGEQAPAEAPPAEAEAQNDDSIAGASGVALQIVGVLFIALGLGDIALYNFEVWDFYAGMGIAGTAIEPYTGAVALGVGVLLMALGKRSLHVPDAVRWVSASVGMLALLFVGIMQVPGVASGSAAERLVRGGSLHMCPNHTVDALVNSFVGDPQWESIIADDGNTYVNMMGEITVDLVPARMLLQFNVDGDEFGLQAIEVDGEAWTLFDGVAVLEKMCDEIGDY